MITSTSSTDYAAAVAASSTGTDGATALPQQNLDQQDFLTLLGVQLANQDPTQPVESTDFIAQMAQFSSLEQSRILSEDMAVMRSDARLQVATAMLGREVTFESEEGTLETATVSAIEPTEDDVLLEIEGSYIPLSAVVRIAPPSVSSEVEGTTIPNQQP